MRVSEPQQEVATTAPRIFATTHWSVVMAAGEGNSEPSRRALETLCETYWYPIYVYVRRKGYGPDDAQDLTQQFFAQLIAKQHLRRADRDKGRFRSFLLATLHYFLAREWCRAHRQRRGGHCQFISLDQQMSEERYRFEPVDSDTPEKSFQRQWAFTVLKQTMNALASECAETGKAHLFSEVKQLISGDRDGATYAAIGTRLSMTETALRVAVHRLRQRYGELLRAEIGQTVESEGEVEEEVRYLMRALSE
jgi:RNA polymerase sigma-70 factor (ECF subfamily)